MNRRCFVVNLKGLIGYGEGLVLQEKAFDKVVSGKADGILLLLEHKPVFTIGRSGGETCSPMKNILNRGDSCKRRTGEKYYLSYPGQIVAYPIFDLKHWKKTFLVRHALRKRLINVLKDGIKAGRKPKYRATEAGDKDCSHRHSNKWITTRFCL